MREFTVARNVGDTHVLGSDASDVGEGWTPMLRSKRYKFF